ncbi:hypothetical protein YC2023_059570 [Brassica napus]
MKCIQYGHEIVALANLLPVDDLHQKLSYQMTPDDDMEDIYFVLLRVRDSFLSITAVSSGAIASDYQQRLRVERVYLFKVRERLSLHGTTSFEVERADIGSNVCDSVAPVGVLHPKEGKSRLNSLEEEQARTKQSERNQLHEKFVSFLDLAKSYRSYFPLHTLVPKRPMMKPGKINWVKETSVVGDISQRNGTMTRVVDGKNMRDCSLHLCPSDEEAS